MNLLQSERIFILDWYYWRYLTSFHFPSFSSLIISNINTVNLRFDSTIKVNQLLIVKTLFHRMATRNKRKLAALNKKNCEEHPRSNLAQNSTAPRSQEDYITQVSEEIEGRVTKKLSQEFSRTENRILGALARLDDFLMNPLLQGHSGTNPETSRNVLSINQGTNEDDSQSDPHPEAGPLTSGREERRDNHHYYPVSKKCLFLGVLIIRPPFAHWLVGVERYKLNVYCLYCNAQQICKVACRM